MAFHDRAEAGHRLAVALAHHRGEDVVVFALPRGGVPVAAPVAAALRAPLDLVLVRKLGVPFQPELAMGAIVDGGRPVVVRNEDVIAMAGVSEGSSRPPGERSSRRSSGVAASTSAGERGPTRGGAWRS